jgi:hypothetical protein
MIIGSEATSSTMFKEWKLPDIGYESLSVSTEADIFSYICVWHAYSTTVNLAE